MAINPIGDSFHSIFTTQRLKRGGLSPFFEFVYTHKHMERRDAAPIQFHKQLDRLPTWRFNSYALLHRQQETISFVCREWKLIRIQPILICDSNILCSK